MTKDDAQLQRIFRSMGEPSWWLLMALAGSPDGLAPFQIIHQVKQALQSAKAPIARVDPATVHYALPRMERLGVIESRGHRVLEVPVGRGATRPEERPIWAITALGETALKRRHRVQRALSRPALLPGAAGVA